MLLPRDHMLSFHKPEGGPYLLAHSAGCLPVTTAEAIERDFLAPWRRAGADAWGAWFDAIDDFRDALTGLLGGVRDQWCPQPSVSGAIFRFVSGLPRQEGRNVILASQEAFPSVAYALEGLARIGFRLELIGEDPSQPGSWARASDPDIAMVVAMHVHSNSGRISPVTEIAALARKGGAAMVVDIAQSVGVIPIDVGSWDVDAVAGTSLKWLCGGPGGCFLWTNPNITERIEPMERGWFSHLDPFEMDIRHFRFAPDARRFWGGTPTIAPYVTASAGIRTIAAIGVDAIARHNAALKQKLFDALPELAANMPANGSAGGTLCLTLGPNEEASLRSAGVACDRRGPIVRLSLAAWNGEDDVGILIDRLRHGAS